MDNLVYRLELEIRGRKIPDVIEVHDTVPKEKDILYLNENFTTGANIDEGFYTVNQVVRSLDMTFSSGGIKIAGQLRLPVVSATYYGKNRPPISS